VAKLIGEVLSEDAPVIPTYVASTEYERFFNPNGPVFPAYVSLLDYVDVRSETCGQVLPLPHYVDISRVTTERRHELLLTSAAMPIIFPARRREGPSFGLDGGLVDSTPITPLLALDVDRIVVIHISNHPWRSIQYVGHRLPDYEWVYRLKQVGVRGCFEIWWDWAEKTVDRFTERFVDAKDLRLKIVRRHLRGKRLVPWHELVSEFRKHGDVTLFPGPNHHIDDSKVLHVIPSCPMNGLVRGTLNFRPSNIQRLMACGHRDGRMLAEVLVAEGDGRRVSLLFRPGAQIRFLPGVEFRARKQCQQRVLKLIPQ
jgi:hypothetical protein